MNKLTTPTSRNQPAALSPSGTTPEAPPVDRHYESSSGGAGHYSTQRPSPTQPFGEYVVACMFLGDRSPIALVAASCATLYLTRANPELLKKLACVFATLFPKHRRAILKRITCRVERRRSRLHLSARHLQCCSTKETLYSISSNKPGPLQGEESFVEPTTVSMPLGASSSTDLPLVADVRRDSIDGDEDSPRRRESSSMNDDESGRPQPSSSLERDPSESEATTTTNGPPSVSRTVSYQLTEEGCQHVLTVQPRQEQSQNCCTKQQPMPVTPSRAPPAIQGAQPPQPTPRASVPSLPTTTTTTTASAAAAATASSSRSISPGGASSHSTIEPLFRQDTFELFSHHEQSVDFLLGMVHRLTTIYFSYNWDVADAVLQVNKQYITYVDEKLIPRVIRWVSEHCASDVAPGFFDDVIARPLPPASHGVDDGADDGQFRQGGKGLKEAGGGSLPHSPAKTSVMSDAPDHPSTVEWLGEDSGDLNTRCPSMDELPSAFPLALEGQSSSSLFLTGQPPQLQDLQGQRDEEDAVPQQPLIPFTVVTSENVNALCRRAELEDRGIVLFFHVPFSQPSCTMWDVLAAAQDDWHQEEEEQGSSVVTSKPPLIGLVYGFADIELSKTFDVAWYPTLILVPRGFCPQAADMILRHAACVEQQALRDELAEVEAAPCQPQQEVGDVDAPAISPRGGCCEVGGSPCVFDDRIDEEELDEDRSPAATDGDQLGRVIGPSTAGAVPSPPCSPCSRAASTASMLRQQIATLDIVIGGGVADEANANTGIISDPTADPRRVPMADGGSDGGDANLEGEEEGHIFFRFPEKGLVLKDAVVEWILGEGKVEAKQRKFKAWITRLVTLTAQMKFKPVRELHSACVMLKRLQGSGGSASGNHLLFNEDGTIEFKDSPRRATPNDPPFFIFLGGGMAAGKTTAATALTQSEWWEAHKDQVVVVDADTFKMADPIRNSKPSDLHAKSTKYAEKLLVTALNQGCSVIFDGTMMWAPFVEQTVAMVRKAHTHHFTMGPGFDAVLGVEQYWCVGEKRKEPLDVPYHVLLLAITVEPHEAVPRGILRTLTTGRSVPIQSQLRSFRLFSQGFETYAKLCDEVTLYNNNVRVDLELGQLPPRILHKEHKDDELVVEDQHAYAMFVRHRTINDYATCCEEIYHPSPTTGTTAKGCNSPRSRQVVGAN